MGILLTFGAFLLRILLFNFLRNLDGKLVTLAGSYAVVRFIMAWLNSVLVYEAYFLEILLLTLINFLVIYVALSLLRRYEGIYHTMIFIGTCVILYFI